MKRSAIHWAFDNKDVPAVQRFIGLVEFLFKFLQKLSEMREPLRRLTRRNASGSGLMSETKPSKRSTTLLKKPPVFKCFSESGPTEGQGPWSASDIWKRGASVGREEVFPDREVIFCPSFWHGA